VSDGEARPETPAVEARDVVKVFDGGRLRALDGLDLLVERKEFVALTGPSGSGKSTLLHLLAALDRPTSGAILVNGRALDAIRDLNRYRRTEIGLVFQLHNLLPHLTATQNVEIAMFGRHLPRRARRERAAELLADVGLHGRGGQRPPMLSGGERQRVAVARALANDPEVLLADEPTGNLDSESVRRVLDLFVRLRAERGVTIVMVTHDQTVAAAADRVVQLIDGRIAREPSEAA